MAAPPLPFLCELVRVESYRARSFAIFKKRAADPGPDLLQHWIGQYKEQPVHRQLFAAQRVPLLDNLRQNALGDVLAVKPGVRAALAPLARMGPFGVIAGRGFLIAIRRIDCLHFHRYDRQRLQIRSDLWEQEVHLERSCFAIGGGRFDTDLATLPLPEHDNLAPIQCPVALPGLRLHVCQQVAVVAESFTGYLADDFKLVPVQAIGADDNRWCSWRLQRAGPPLCAFLHFWSTKGHHLRAANALLSAERGGKK